MATENCSLTDSLVLAAQSGIFRESLKCNEINSAEGLVAKALQNDLKQATGMHSSDQTVRNRDHEGGLRARHPLVEPVHTLESEDPLFGSQFSSQMSTFTLSIVSIFSRLSDLTCVLTYYQNTDFYKMAKNILKYL